MPRRVGKRALDRNITCLLLRRNSLPVPYSEITMQRLIQESLLFVFLRQFYHITSTVTVLNTIFLHFDVLQRPVDRLLLFVNYC